jgi:hypothetical protein
MPFGNEIRRFDDQMIMICSGEMFCGFSQDLEGILGTILGQQILGESWKCPEMNNRK